MQAMTVYAITMYAMVVPRLLGDGHGRGGHTGTHARMHRRGLREWSQRHGGHRGHCGCARRDFAGRVEWRAGVDLTVLEIKSKHVLTPSWHCSSRWKVLARLSACMHPALQTCKPSRRPKCTRGEERKQREHILAQVQT